MSEEYTLRYETEGMAELRRLLTEHDRFTHEQVDTFKWCLSWLEGQGFRLVKGK